MNGNIIISSFRQSGPVGQIVLILLFFVSVYVWVLMWEKYTTLRRARILSLRFMRDFREFRENFLELFEEGEIPASPLYAVFRTGCEELARYFHKAGNPGTISVLHLDGIDSALQREISYQRMFLGKSLIILSTTATVAPLLGLLGTVTGILRAFRNMAAQGSAGISTVAPGIAEALVTTVAGLIVAIPAMVAYNYFVNRIRTLSTQMENFSSEFLSEVRSQYVEH